MSSPTVNPTDLVLAWIPALDGVEDRLRYGATAALLGPGQAEAAALMADVFPRSMIAGFDLGSAAAVPGTTYDLVCLLGAPPTTPTVSAHIRDALLPDGTLLIAGAGNPTGGGSWAAVAAGPGFTAWRPARDPDDGR